jgi:hypothetical protein
MEKRPSYDNYTELDKYIDYLKSQLIICTEALGRAIEDLEASGYCFDHPFLISLRNSLNLAKRGIADADDSD